MDPQFITFIALVTVIAVAVYWPEPKPKKRKYSSKRAQKYLAQSEAVSGDDI